MKTIKRLKRIAGTLTLAGGLYLGLNSLHAESGTSSGNGTYESGSTGSGSSSMTSGSSDTGSDRGFNLGWIGLLGLAGLFGLKRHHEGYETHGSPRAI